MPPARRSGRSGTEPPASDGRAHASPAASDGPAQAASDRPDQDESASPRAARAGSRAARAPAKPDSRGRRAAGKRPAPGTKPTAASKRTTASQPAAEKRRSTKPAADKRTTASQPAAAKRADTVRPAASPPGGDRAVLDEDHDAAVRPHAEAAEATDAALSARRRHSRLLLPAVLALVTVLLGSFAVWSGARAHTLTSSAGQNTALTDNATTTRIIGQVTTAVGDIFSYSYADPARTQRAGQRDLTGQAVQQYRTLYRNLQREAARYSQLVLTTTVTDAGVEVLQGNRARVLVFANQVLTGGSQTPHSFSAMVALDVVQEAGTWKIDNIDTFTGAR